MDMPNEPSLGLKAVGQMETRLFWGIVINSVEFGIW